MKKRSAIAFLMLTILPGLLTKALSAPLPKDVQMLNPYNSRLGPSTCLLAKVSTAQVTGALPDRKEPLFSWCWIDGESGNSCTQKPACVASSSH